jgi:phosphatidate phosphatase APP1
MAVKIPILLSFYGISNGESAVLSGQLTYSSIKDFTFKDYSRRKTFRTLVSLYRTKPYADQFIVLVFDRGKVHMKTDAFGSFYGKTTTDLSNARLEKVLMVSGEEVKIIDGLFPTKILSVDADYIVVSDIDDTLMHSYIYRKLLKVKTLMFTAVEKRKSVVAMQDLLKQFVLGKTAFFYLSNSEQNLHPLIYRFLNHHGFPFGPLFLKKMRSLWDVFWNVKFPFRNLHKEQTLVNLFALFPNKKFVLMGDNTQYDLPVYLAAAEKYPDQLHSIIIRKVVKKAEDEPLINKHLSKLKEKNIQLFYASQFPEKFVL